MTGENTPLTGENTPELIPGLTDFLNNSTFAQWIISLKQTIGSSGDRVGKTIADAMSSIWDAFINHTYVGNILGFIWDLIMFLLYAVRSIVLILWNVIYRLLNSFGDLFQQVNSTFEDLSIFMGNTTTILFSFFTLILLIIVCGFLFRFFIGKYHYNHKIKRH